MSFLRDLGEGFFTGAAERMKAKDEAALDVKKQTDIYKAQSIAKLDADKQLEDYKLKNTLKEYEAAQRARRGERLSDDMQNIQGSAAPSAVDVPEVDMSDGDSTYFDTNMNTNVAPEKTVAELYEELNTFPPGSVGAKMVQSDIDRRKAILQEESTQRGIDESKRKKAREGVISFDGQNPAELIAKSEEGLLKGDKLDASLYEKYFGVKKALSTSDDADTPFIRKVERASSQARTMSTLLAEATADEYGKSNVSGQQLALDAQDFVLYKNLYSESTDPNTKTKAYENLQELLQKYPEKTQEIIEYLGLEAAPDETPAEPVELTKPERKVTPEGTIVRNAEGKRMIKKGGTWQPL